MGRARHKCPLVGLLVIFFLGSGAHGGASERVEWTAYGNDPGGMRYSPLRQINRTNVTQLKIARVVVELSVVGVDTLGLSVLISELLKQPRTSTWPLRSREPIAFSGTLSPCSGQLSPGPDRDHCCALGRMCRSDHFPHRFKRFLGITPGQLYTNAGFEKTDRRFELLLSTNQGAP